MGLRANSLVVRVRRAGVVAQVSFDYERNVTLEYNDYYFNTLTEDEIEATLAHESCHISTLPDIRISAPAADSPEAAFIDIFREYLAHSEFARKFTGTKKFEAWKHLKTRDFRNYEHILTIAQAGKMDIMKALFGILNDAVYFPVAGDQRFAEWCKKNRLTHLPRFLDWLIDDFKFIQNLKLQRTETDRLLMIEAALSSAVNYCVLLGDYSRGRSLFTPTAEAVEEICSKRSETPLINVWRNRRVAEAQ
jgi:hypothetical protein